MKPRMRQRKQVQDARDQFAWLLDIATKDTRNQTCENIVAALEWVLRMNDKANPIPDLLEQIRKMRPLKYLSGNFPTDK